MRVAAAERKDARTRDEKHAGLESALDRERGV